MLTAAQAARAFAHLTQSHGTCARRLLRAAGWARRAERSVWALLVSLLWPAVFALIAAIAGMVVWAAISPATLQASLLSSLVLVLFVLVMVTVLLGADADADADAESRR